MPGHGAPGCMLPRCCIVESALDVLQHTWVVLVICVLNCSARFVFAVRQGIVIEVLRSIWGVWTTTGLAPAILESSNGGGGKEEECKGYVLLAWHLHSIYVVFENSITKV